MEVRPHPRRHKAEVLLQLFPVRGGKVITDALEMMWSDMILANVAQGLSDEAARPAGQRKIAPAIATEDDLEFAKIDAGAGAVGMIHHLRGYLSIKSEQIGGYRFGRKDSEVLISSNRRDNRVGGGACLSKNRMRLGGIVDSAADPANLAVAHEPGEGHSDGSRVAKICKIVWRERPATALFGNAPKNLPRMGNRKPGCFHVENNALFFQQIKIKPRFTRSMRLPCVELTKKGV